MPTTVINAALKFIEKRIDAAAEKVAAAFRSSKTEIDTTPIAAVIARQAAAFEKALSGLKSLTIDANVDIDTSEIESLVKEATGRLEMPDLATIEISLADIYECIEKSRTDQLVALKEGFAEVAKAVREIKAPTDTLKLDKMQLRELAASRTGGGPTTLTASRVTVKNLSMPDANTEYSYAFPPNTLSWTIRVRDTDVPLLYSYTTGTLPTSGDGSAYGTVPAYYLNSQTGVEWSAKTIYLQTASAGQVAEIISYQI